jgi:osmoprotectant transport system ATP-binding protein
LATLTRGTITVNGQDVMKTDPVKLRQSMGYAIQQIGLFPNKTIADNISTVPRLLGWDKKRIQDRVDELLSMVQLEPAVFGTVFRLNFREGSSSASAWPAAWLQTPTSC